VRLLTHIWPAVALRQAVGRPELLLEDLAPGDFRIEMPTVVERLVPGLPESAQVSHSLPLGASDAQPARHPSFFTEAMSTGMKALLYTAFAGMLVLIALTVGKEFGSTIRLSRRHF
jgi:hypothetical protein